MTNFNSISVDKYIYQEIRNINGDDYKIEISKEMRKYYISITDMNTKNFY